MSSSLAGIEMRLLPTMLSDGSMASNKVRQMRGLAGGG
jgi:hypothetical protein